MTATTPETAASYRPLTHRETMWIVLGVLVPVLMASLDQSMVASALPTIGREFGDTRNLSWIVAANLLTMTPPPRFTASSATQRAGRSRCFLDWYLYGGGHRFCAGAERLGAGCREGASGYRQRRSCFDGHDRAGRCRGPQATGPLLYVFFDRLYERGSIGSCVRWFLFRVHPLERRVLDGRAAWDRRLAVLQQRCWANCPARKASQTRYSRRIADCSCQLDVHVHPERRRQELAMAIAANHRHCDSFLRSLGGIFSAACDSSRTPDPDCAVA